MMPSARSCGPFVAEIDGVSSVRRLAGAENRVTALHSLAHAAEQVFREAAGAGMYARGSRSTCAHTCVRKRARARMVHVHTCVLHECTRGAIREL